MTDKITLRRHYTAVREQLSADRRARAEAAIQEALFALPAWKNAPLICGYAATRGEIDLSPIWERAVADGKPYALPVTTTGAREGQMIFRKLSDYAPHLLVEARFGIQEPPSHYPTLTLSDFQDALMLVPGLAFDDGGFRIGYGGGYYDRFLASLAHSNIRVITVGLAFSVCRTTALPHESHDYPVHYIIDERRVICPRGTP